MSNITGASRGIINFHDLSGSNQLGIHYFEEWTKGTTFLEIFLQRVKMVRGLDHVAAYVHPSLESKLAPILEQYSIQPIVLAGLSSYASIHQRLISSRKWSYQCWKGCPLELSYFDEIVAMGLIAHFNEITKPSKLVYFSPEAPFFDPKATDLLLQKLGTHLEQKELNVLYQPSPLGMSAFCIHETALSRLSPTSVWLPRDYISVGSQKQSLMLRHLLGLPLVPNDRRNFLLRSKRDVKRLQKWDGKFGRIEEPCEVPREIQLEVTSSPYNSLCRLPTLSPSDEMPAERLARLFDEIGEVDDALVTVGDLGNLWHYTHLNELKEILKSNRPYGIHVVLDAKIAFENFEELNTWLDLGLDVVTLRLTSLGYQTSDLERHEDLVSQMSQRYRDPSYHTIINLELYKFHDNWRQIEVLQKWREKFNMPFSWVSFNHYCQQSDHRVDLPEYFPRGPQPCQKLIHQMHILPNGDVTPCRQDFSGKRVISNVSNGGIREIWNSDEFVEMRNKNNGIDKPTSLCENCHNGYYV